MIDSEDRLTEGRERIERTDEAERAERADSANGQRGQRGHLSMYLSNRVPHHDHKYACEKLSVMKNA